MTPNIPGLLSNEGSGVGVLFSQFYLLVLLLVCMIQK